MSWISISYFPPLITDCSAWSSIHPIDPSPHALVQATASRTSLPKYSSPRPGLWNWMPTTLFSVPYIWYLEYALFSYFFSFYISLISPRYIKTILKTFYYTLPTRTWQITAAQEILWLWIVNIATNTTSCLFQSNPLDNILFLSSSFWSIFLKGFLKFTASTSLLTMPSSIHYSHFLTCHSKKTLFSNVNFCFAKCHRLLVLVPYSILSPSYSWPKLASFLLVKVITMIELPK